MSLRALAAVLALWPAAAEPACRQALALGLDVSGSVDAREYRLQLDGLAGALTHDEVAGAILAFPGSPVRIFVYEWAGFGHSRVVQPWREIAGPEDLAAVAGALRATARVPMDPATALGEALTLGAAALAAQPGCARHTLDLSGDGTSNSGPRPRDVTTPGIVVNGLVIGTARRADTDNREPSVSELRDYYEAEVIRGPGAFTEITVGFEDYEEAMARKLLKELTHLVLSRSE